MCLRVTRSTPYNHSRIGYKLLCREGTGSWFSPFRGSMWPDGYREAHAAAPMLREGAEVYHGIHIFPHLKDAIKCYNADIGRKNYGFGLVKVKVSGFIAAGKHDHYSDKGNGTLGECWQHAKIVKILRCKKERDNYERW